MPSRSWITVPIDQEVWGVPDEGYAPHFFPPEGDYLLFHFTEESFMRVLSALINGAALTYPDTWLQVVWDFLKNVEYPVSLCDQIASCIAESEAVQTNLRAFVTNDESIRDWAEDIANIAVLTVEQRGQNLLKPEACDPGYTFNQASKFVFLLNQLAEDLFEALEVGTNALERAEKLISAIPAIGGLLPFDEIIGLADDLISNIQEDYMGAYDQGMYDDLRCGLWCTFKDTCDLDIDETLIYYQDKLGETLPQDPVSTLQAILSFLVLGDIPGDAPVYAMHLLIIAAMRAGQEMFGINFAQLGIRITAAGDESDNDYATLCSECVEPPTLITPVATFGDYTGLPKTFLGYTPSGGSRWQMTFQTAASVTAIAITTKVAGVNSCARTTLVTGAVSYQHLLCAGGAATGSGGGESDTIVYGPDFGWFGATAGDLLEVVFELP
jgi:hypothetical protein